eukprot:GEMP01009539.1.p1 GENE.GEMP01009539.1~~GEMP01009539.1.p1  ORF type:complete len:497 (+),score=94.67 GEMP01009539.1:88-1578(+)
MLVGLFDFRTECWKNVFAAADGRKFKVEIAEVTVTLQKVTDTHRNLSPSEPGRNIPGLSTYGSMIHGFSLLLSMASSLLCKNTDFMYKVYSLGQKINLLQKDSAKVVDEAIPLASSQEDNGQENGAGAGDVGGVLAGDDLQRPPDACDRVAKELNALSAITRTQEELAYAISQSIPVIKEEDADFGMGQVEHTVEAESDELFSQLLTNTAEDMDVDDPVGHSRNLDGLRKRASEADGQPNSDDGCRLEGNEIGESPFSVHYAACPSDAENERVDGDLVPDSVPAGEESQAGDGEAPLLEVQMDRDQLGAALVQQERLTKKYFDDAKSVRNVRIKTHGFVNIDRIEFDIKTELFHDYQSLSQWSSAIYEDAFDLSKMDKDDLWLMNMLPFGEAARQECMDEWYVPRHEEDPVFQRNPEAHINEEIYVDEDATIYENDYIPRVFCFPCDQLHRHVFITTPIRTGGLGESPPTILPQYNGVISCGCGVERSFFEQWPIW